MQTWNVRLGLVVMLFVYPYKVFPSLFFWLLCFASRPSSSEGLPRSYSDSRQLGFTSIISPWVTPIDRRVGTWLETHTRTQASIHLITTAIFTTAHQMTFTKPSYCHTKFLWSFRATTMPPHPQYVGSGYVSFCLMKKDRRWESCHAQVAPRTMSWMTIHRTTRELVVSDWSRNSASLSCFGVSYSCQQSTYIPRDRAKRR